MRELSLICIFDFELLSSFGDIFYCFVFFKFSLLSNPEVLRTLRNVEGLMSTQSKQQAELDKIKEMRKEAEFDKHLAQTVQVRLL